MVGNIMMENSPTRLHAYTPSSTESFLRTIILRKFYLSTKIVLDWISTGIYKDKISGNPEGFSRFSLLAWWMNFIFKKFQGNKYAQ